MDVKGHRLVWQWQYLAQAEQTPEAVADTLKQYAGSDTLLIKVMDGSDYQGVYDPLSPHGYSEWANQRFNFASNDILAIPWVVAQQSEDAREHVNMVEIGGGDTLVVDLEPYAQFWQGDDFNAYLNNLSGFGPSPDDYQCWVSIDARPWAWDALNVDSWCNRVAGLIPQVYWTDFQQDPWACVDMVYRCMVAMGSGSKVIPALPYNAVTESNAETPDMLLFWRICQGWGSPAPSLWRLGSANIQQLQQFGGLPV